MSEVAEKETTKTSQPQVNGLFAFKVGMSAVFNENGKRIPVTVLKYDPIQISQLKTKEKDGYDAVQMAFTPQKAKRVSKSVVSHLKKAGYENGARFVREVRGVTEGLKVGQKLPLKDILSKGQKINITSTSKGYGFSGVMKRHNFSGQRASHGSSTHRAPGSIGNCAYPGRVILGRKMPGHSGFVTVSVPRTEVVDIIEKENVILVKGPVPGARSTLVRVTKV